jgi:hypothetical protein
MRSETDLSNLEEVRSFVSSLPPPAPGRVRVFRGQSRDYGKLIPSSFRNPQGARSRAIWRAYSQYLAEGIWRERPEQAGLLDRLENLWQGTAELKGIPPDYMADTHFVWLHAIIQHYGPGSPYLDVTRSLDIAIWFALHRFETVACPAGISETYTGGDWHRYSGPYETGHLYVIDTEKWVRGKAPTPGILVDLLDGPDVFHSARILRQSACLLYADQENPDLLKIEPKLCVASKALSFFKPPLLEGSYHDLFPGPEIDDWYRRVLSAPFVPRTERPEAPLSHSLPVTIYAPDPSNAAPLMECLQSLDPPLLYPAFRQFVDIEKYLALFPHASADAILNPLPILLDAPLIYSSPQFESQMWHEGLLAVDRPHEIPLWLEGSPKELVPATNVFIEFSPLEHSDWHKRDPVEFPRAIWLMDDRTRLGVTFYIQKDSGNRSDSGLRIVGPAEVCYSLADEQFLWRWGATSDWQPSSSSPPLSKCLYVALELLRQLAPWPKPLAYPFMALGKENGDAAFLVVGVRDMYRLQQPTPGELKSHVFVRLAGTDEPHTGMISDIRKCHTRMGLVSAEEPGEKFYSAIDVMRLRAGVLKADEDGYLEPKEGGFAAI